MWINWALRWAEAVEPNYHQLVIFFYVLQTYLTRGALPVLKENPNGAELIDNIRRGLENNLSDQTIPDPSKQIGAMVKDTVLDAFGDLDNQYAI